MTGALSELLSASPQPQPIASLDVWWRRHRTLAERVAEPIDLALCAGFAADRLGYAFASGYQAAATVMFATEPTADPSAAGPSALCATEAGGAHPRAIETTLKGEPGGALQLDGVKTMVTLGTVATRLFVVCHRGMAAAGRKRFVVVAIDRRDGVSISELPIGGIIPEIPHAEVRLQAVAVAPHEVLPGDGYERYLKPFRTVEDLYVHASLSGWLMQIARRSGWPRAQLEDMASHVVGLRALAAADPSAPTTHVALAGLLSNSKRWLETTEPLWQQVDEHTRQAWQRDRALLAVAGKARARRLEVAWERADQRVRGGACRS